MDSIKRIVNFGIIMPANIVATCKTNQHMGSVDISTLLVLGLLLVSLSF
jgi:hypothetical protein